MTEERLPTGLWVEAQLRQMDQDAISYYLINKGAYFSGTVVLKINSINDGCQVLTQIRDENGKLGWMNALKAEWVVESEADAYVRRAIDRDQDIWAIEIEDPAKNVLKHHFILA